MNTGIVKWFNNKKGFGFIIPHEGDEDVFVHYSAIEGDGFRTLAKGADVQFEMERGPKGWHANHVVTHKA
jgi:CspA family cold shock protein